MEQPTLKNALPPKMGIILGVLYCLFIYIENAYFSKDTILFAASKTLGYLIILGGIFYTAFKVKQEAGGYIIFKDCLRSMLVVIAICELFYVLFNFIYVTYIDPEFFNRLRQSTLTFLQNAKLSKEEIANRMKTFDGSGKANFWSVFQSYGFAIIIDAVFAVIFASMLKKNPVITDNQTNY